MRISHLVITGLIISTVSNAYAISETIPKFDDPYQNLKFYYGDNHFHSGFSGDNKNDDHPLTAFINAAMRVKSQGADASMGGDPTPDLGGYFLFISDHAKFIPTRKDMTNDMYQVMKQEANDARGNFQGPAYTFTIFTGAELTGLARKGVEYPPWDDKFGHLNIFNVKDIERFTENSVLYNIKGTVAMDRLAQEKSAIGQFNHPGYNNEPRTGDNSSSLYPYTPARDRVFNFFEVTDGFPDNWDKGVAQYNICLHKGYHVSPVVGSDVHDTKSPLLFDTGSARKVARTVIIAPSTVNMTQDDRRKILLDSVRKGMVYVSEDSNLQIKVSINGFPMGHRFLIMPEVLVIFIEVKDPGSPGVHHRSYDDTDKLQSIELVQNKNCIVADKDVSSESDCTRSIQKWLADDGKKFKNKESVFTDNFSHFFALYVVKPESLPNLKYIYLKVVQQDGDRAMTTPFFFNESIIK